MAVKAAELLAAENISARVINIATIKPLDEEIILSAARDCKRIVTVEEHSIGEKQFVMRNAQCAIKNPFRSS